MLKLPGMIILHVLESISRFGSMSAYIESVRSHPFSTDPF